MTARRPVTIGGIAFDALIDESKSYEADVPSYPVESGFEVSDTIILKPLTLSMTLFLTNTPVTWKTRNGSGRSRVPTVLAQLERLYFSKKSVTIITSECTYRNMVILSFELKKSLETGTSREIPISFQEIRITHSRTTTIPDSYGKSGQTGTNAGAASVTSSSTSSSSDGLNLSGNSNGSVLFGLASGAGLLK